MVDIPLAHGLHCYCCTVFYYVRCKYVRSMEYSCRKKRRSGRKTCAAKITETEIKKGLRNTCPGSSTHMYSFLSFFFPFSKLSDYRRRSERSWVYAQNKGGGIKKKDHHLFCKMQSSKHQRLSKPSHFAIPHYGHVYHPRSGFPARTVILRAAPSEWTAVSGHGQAAHRRIGSQAPRSVPSATVGYPRRWRMENGKWKMGKMGGTGRCRGAWRITGAWMLTRPRYSYIAVFSSVGQSRYCSFIRDTGYTKSSLSPSGSSFHLEPIACTHLLHTIICSHKSSTPRIFRQTPLLVLRYLLLTSSFFFSFLPFFFFFFFSLVSSTPSTDHVNGFEGFNLRVH